MSITGRAVRDDLEERQQQHHRAMIARDTVRHAEQALGPARAALAKSVGLIDDPHILRKIAEHLCALVDLERDLHARAGELEVMADEQGRGL